MTIDWLSTLICIRISFWLDTLSWQAATALTHEDVEHGPARGLALQSSALMQYLLVFATNWLSLSGCCYPRHEKTVEAFVMSSGLKDSCGCDLATGFDMPFKSAAMTLV